jgi:hypothetical protein
MYVTSHTASRVRQEERPADSFQDAIDALNSLQTPFDVVEARRKAGIRPDAVSIKEMQTYLHRIGYTVRLLAVRHVHKTDHLTAF